MIKRLSLAIVLLFMVSMGFNAGAAVRNDWFCVPGVRVGPITDKTGEKDLKAMFGAENVTRETIWVAEGTEQMRVTYLYKARKAQIEIRWADEKAGKYCLAVRINSAGGRWHTKDGIRVGTSLERVNQVNGKPFKFYGFGWDYGGIVYDWGKGKLDKSGLDLRFDYRDTTERAMKYMGDGVDIRSDNPGLKGLGVKVSEMVVILHRNERKD